MMILNAERIIISIGIFLLFGTAKSEFYSSVFELGKLLRTEEEIMKSLELYLKLEEMRLEKVKRLSVQYAKLYQMASQDVESFLSNPVNAFLLLKHLTVDWKIATILTSSNKNKAVVEHGIDESLNFPNSEDLKGVSAALMRLQELYFLDSFTIAEGRVKGTEAASKFTASDCFEMGRQAYNSMKLNHTLHWMKEALQRLDGESQETANRTQIVEYMAFSAFVLKNYTRALELNEYLLQLDPRHQVAQANLLYCKYMIKQEKRRRAKGMKKKRKSTKPESEVKNGYLSPHIIQSYEKLCRGESVKTSKEKSQLFCFYTTNNNSYLLLQPVKAEVLNLKPWIVVYHNVLQDWEAEVIKLLAAPKLVKDRVVNATSGTNVFSSFRISMSVGVSDNDHFLIPKINQRIEDITGLNLETAEIFDVINYGIGGHYSTHLDYAKPGDKVPFLRTKRNRIATWIFYLSDVPAGGSTVFPSIGVEVKPEKGAAVFWPNLKRNGDGDMDTQHAACPVLLGSKWVANKWIHEAGNEFRRKCSLDPSE